MVAVTARDVMSREFVGVSEGDTVGDVLELMVEQEADDVLVLRGSEPVGVVSGHDVLGAVAEDELSRDESVESLMGPAPTPVAPDSDVDTVLAKLSSAVGDQLPVANGDDQLLGVVSDADVIAAASSLVSEPRDADAPTGPEGVGTGGAAGVDAAAQGTARASIDASPERTPETSAQGVCESCGTLSGDLQVVNGQSNCPECRDV